MSMADELFTLQFDGGSRGNPGPAGSGAVVLAADGTPIVTVGKFIGRATNNVAEYTGVIVALEEALKLGAKKISIKGDSELIIKQLKGEYRVKHPDMKVLYERAMNLIRKFDTVTIGHNLRHKNELADKLANLAMDRRGDVTDIDGDVRGSVPWAAGGGQGAVDSGQDTGGSAQGAVGGGQDVRESGRGAGGVPVKFGCQVCGCVMRVERQPLLPGHPMKAPVCLCGQGMKSIKT